MLINTPEKFRIMIDGGPGDKMSNYLGLNFPFSGKDIDLLVISHPHEDHILGAIDILKRYNVKKVLGAGVDYESPAYRALLKIIKEKKIDFIIGFQGEVLKFGDLELEVLYPFESINDKQISNINNSSIILRAKYKNFYVLFPGDVEKDITGKLLISGVDLRADLLKVSHQGSKNGFQNLDKMLDKIDPKIAIISVGKNSFGHPESETLKALELNGIKTMRTDRDEDIVIESDGNQYWIK